MADDDDDLERRQPAGARPSFLGLGGEQRFRAAVAEVTAGADPTGRWLGALCPLLRQLLDYDAAWLGSFDRASGRYLPLLDDGDVEPLRRLFATDEAAQDVQRLGFRQPGWPLLGSMIKVQLEQLYGFRTYLAPAGFRDGLGTGLTTGAGRHVGHLTLLTYNPGTSTVVAAAFLNAASSLIADAVERVAAERAREDPREGPIVEPRADWGP